MKTESTIKPLSALRFIIAYLLTYIEGAFLKNIKLENTHINKKYELLNTLKKQRENNSQTFLGIFKRSGDKKVVIKSVIYFLKTLPFLQLQNEANIYLLLNSLKKKSKSNSKVIFPEVIEINSTKNEFSLVIEHVAGTPLFYKSNKVKLASINMVLQTFANLSRFINKNQYKNLTKRSPLHILIFFPLYLTKVLLLDFKNASNYLKLGILFYKYYLSLPINKRHLSLAHKDLHSRNIIVSNNLLYVIDPEICVLAEPETDIANILRYYSSELSLSEISEIMTKNSLTDKQSGIILALSIFYSIQIMAIRPKNDSDYIEAEKYISKCLPYLVLKTGSNHNQTFVEAIFYKIITLITKFKFTHTGRISNRPSVILAYHSVSNDVWKYAITAKNFNSHVKYLLKNYKITSLDYLVKHPYENGLAAITFDDGYKDVYLQAFPIMKRYNIPATVFILGSKNVNRPELGNNIKLLDLKMIKILIANGWEIGFHSDTHPNLASLSKKSLLKEIYRGKIKLEKILGIKLKYFAYPKGKFNQSITTIVIRSGFDAAFTVDGGYTNIVNKYLISRTLIENNISVNQFTALISSTGIRLASLLSKSLKFKDSLLRII